MDLRRSVTELVDEQLWPRSAEVDRGTTLPLDHFDALASLGLYGMAIPKRHGGLGMPGSEIRATLQLLASGCGVTAFAFAQHHGTVGAVVTTDNIELRDRWLPELAADKLAGIAYAHVRRRGAPVLTAAADGGGGWTLNGVAPWVTSWGVASVIGTAATTDDGRLLWVLVPATEGSGLTVGKAFDLMAYSATQTVALNFDDYRVGPEHVLSVVEFESWSERDRLLAARPNPLCVGIGDRALAELARISPDVAADFAPWWADVAAIAEANSQAVEDAVGGPTDDPGDAFDLHSVATARAETVLATQRLTTALLAATGGAAMELGHPAQRLSREALFYVIQAQSSDGRSAMLERLGQGPGAAGSA